MSDTGNSGNQAPPGWYPDGQGGQRWWDGSAWAEPGQGPTPAAGEPGQAGQAGQSAWGEPQPTAQYPVADPAANPYGQPSPTAPFPAVGANHPYPGQVPGGPEAPRRRRTGLVVGLVGGVVALAALATVLLLVLGGGDGPSSDDPAETVEAFLAATKDVDCDAALELVTDRFTKEVGGDCDEDFEPGADLDDLGIDLDDLDFEVGKAKVDGDSATVPVSLEGLPVVGDMTFDYQLKKVDGVWLIDDFGLDLGGFEMPDLDDLTDLPSGLPSDLPTEMPDLGDLDGFPTEFPTDLFENLPTEFPTDLFENLPTEFPTDLFENFPTEFPTDLFENLPTELPTS